MSDPKRLNPSATTILRRTLPEWNMILISEPIALEIPALAQLVKANMNSASKSATFGPESRETFGGIEFVHFEADLVVPGVKVPLAAAYWLTSKAGISYQFYTFGAKEDRERGLREARGIMSTFQLLDPNRPSADHEAVVDARPEAVGFSTQLSKLDWKRWADAEANAPGQLFAAVHGGTHYFTAYAVQLDEKGSDIEDLARAFSHLYALKYPSETARGEPSTVRGANAALRISAEKTLETVPLVYRAIVATAERRAFFFVAWQAKAVTNDTRLLDDALATVEIPATPVILPAAIPKTKQTHQADLLHELGLIHSERKEWQRAAELFGQAYAISQHNDATLESLAFTMEQGGEVQAAKDLLDKHADRIPKRRDLLTLRARLNDKLADAKAAMADFAKAFDEGCRDEDDLLYFMNLLIREKRAPDAIKTVEAYLARGSTQRVRRFQAQAYSSSGDLKRAMELYEDILAKPPFDPFSAYELGECANDAEDYTRATATAERLLKAGKDNERTRLIEGWSHFGRKEWREAKASFEKARSFVPEEPAVTNALARASAMLGEGDNSAAKTELTPVALPDALLDELAKIEHDTPVPAGTSACYLRRATAFSFHVGKPYASTLYRRVRVLDDAGVADFGTLHFQFDPLAEQIFVNRLMVTDENGKVVAEGKPEEQYVVDQSSVSAEGTHRKILRIIVPGLKPGRTIEYTVTRRERANATEFPYQRFICTTQYPVITETVLLEGDTARVRTESSAAFAKIAVAREGKGVRTWLIRTPPAWKSETRLPGSDTYLPILHLGDAKATWASESSAYLRQIASVLKPDEATRTLAQNLVKDLQTTEDKVRVLARHVQKNVTYQAVEFGRRARIPKPAERVLASHYGDCKDQSLLLHLLLSAAGIPSQLALINSGSETQAALPSLDQFDHMIVHVPGLKAAFVDPTASHFPAGALPPELFKRNALVLDPAKPRLEAMPDRALFAADRISLERDISLATSGEAVVSEAFSLSGYQASAMRNWLAGIKPAERLAAIQGLIPAARWRLQNLDIEALDDDERVLTLKLRYTIPAATSSAGKSATLVMPAYWEQDYLRAPFLKERRQPFELIHPLHVDSRATIRFAGTPEQDALRSFARSGGSEFCTWKTQAVGPERKGGAATLTFHFEGRSGVFPAARYSDWQGEWNAATEAWQSPIRQE
jgi:transglutaminase-like putative cysteine protease/tetratricopeptide (TPR) repeat protein